GTAALEIRAAIEALERVGADERESAVATIERLLSQAEADEVHLPLWTLQNLWWRVMRDRVRPLDGAEARVAMKLGFAP
ncbi:MAG: hypothetical protein WBP17_03495, partial [Gemmatimonadota bacterium]